VVTCELLGVTLTAAHRARLDGADSATLSQTLDALRRTRALP
jgi:hypothetical protein